MTALDGWDNFYVIVGSSAGALIGLQFIVVTLIADTPTAKRDPQASGAFATPSVVHFEVVLFLSAIVCIPWVGIAAIAVIWGLMGFCGLIYSAIVNQRLRRQTSYQPVFEDWLFHVLLPFAAYAMLTLAGCVARSRERAALFLVAAAALVLLFTGIHNAWDTVTYHIFIRKQEKLEPGGTSKSEEQEP